ncbi:site-specific integrase [Gemmatimonas sp.]|uniref:tyrosine-type recombinase/integrase n=1 Tax=Gemmatimonas sp. TaxID=1962908 RepID=UPI0025C02258|nr:site-specific integrase [Gemmatimonas sp.]MCA2992497.1 site-specific integrase [Gemmatimonas sp.]
MKDYSEKFIETLPASERRAYRQFESEVLTYHLKRRDKNDPKSPFVLDRRNALLGHQNRETLGKPPELGKQTTGRSTTDRGEAEFWVIQHYAPKYWRELHATGSKVSLVQLTVQEAVERYIGSLYEKDPNGGADPHLPRRYKSRVSKLKRHVVPALGPMLIATLQPDHVTNALDTMLVTPREPGRPPKREAMRSTKKEALKALTAVWKYTFPNEVPPFKKAHIAKDNRPVVRPDINANNLPVMDWELRELTKKGVLSPEDVVRSFVGAMHWTTQVSTIRHLRNVLLNGVHILALLIGLGVRVSELVTLRWHHFNFDELFVLVPQSKLAKGPDGALNKDPYRIVPLQQSLVPWLKDLMRIYGILDHRNCASFVVQLTRKKIHSNVPASEDSVEGRVSKMLKHAGTKIKGKSTHCGRATHVSIAATSGKIPTHLIKAFVGHSAFNGDVTDAYFKLTYAYLKPEHRTYLTLPSIKDVTAKAKRFKPNTDG